MKKLCLIAAVMVAATAAVIAANVGPAEARPPYKKEFDAKYVKKDSTDPTEKKFAEAAEAAKCGICHVGMDKKMRNSYGDALSKLLTKADVKDTAKINSALDTVAGQPSSSGGPTFGELIKEGKLPGK